jgi:hypothetical protein
LATTVGYISGFLDDRDIKHEIDEDVVKAWFETEHYTDKDGDHGIFVVIALEEDGEYIKIVAPMVYQATDNPHLRQLFQVLLMVSWFTKLVQFEYDHTDGEIRAIVEFPLEDAPLTERQLLRSIQGLVAIVDEADSVIRSAMDHGIIDSKHPFFTGANGSDLAAILSAIGWDSEGDPLDDDIDTLTEEFREFLRNRRRKDGN